MHWHGVMSKFACWKLLKLEVEKKSIFGEYLQNGVEFWRSICAGLRRSGTLRNGCKKLGISLKLFHERAPNYFL